MDVNGRALQPPAVLVKQLVKVFPGPDKGELRAVDGISFEIAQGEVFGLLGPNGAGKTTTLEIIEGIQRATSGEVRVMGHDVATNGKDIKPLIGVQLQSSAFFERLPLDELLVLYGAFYGVQADAGALLQSVGLVEKRKSLLSKLSGGQARRFSIAACMVSDPQIVFLDEPTSGLDPQARRSIWDQVSEMRSKGKTVVLTTHYMDEAEALCDRIGIIDHGQIKALDTPLNLIQALDSAYHIRFTATGPVPTEKLKSLQGVARITSSSNGDITRYDLEVANPGPILDDFTKVMGAGLKSASDLRIEPSTLEDVFLSLTGRELRD